MLEIFISTYAHLLNEYGKEMEEEEEEEEEEEKKKTAD